MNEWWRKAVFYQIYPRSFQDSNGDGIGDLRGIIERLDYLNDRTPDSLGIGAIWLSPTFPSPMKDFGYDVADYRAVHPDFGTLEDMDHLIAECHKRGIRLLLDYVPNHSSDMHPWFLESRSTRDNPKRDWYIWMDPRPDGSPPNNWISVFGGPAWTFDPATEQYYLHSFLREQPDLNWRNPEVVQAMHDVLRFWLNRGIDGFRIDVMGRVLKDPEFRDNPPNPEWDDAMPEVDSQIPIYTHNFEDVFDAVEGIREVFDEYPGTMAVGEVFGSADVIAKFHGRDNLNGLHLAFNFNLMFRGGVTTPWDAGVIRGIVTSLNDALPPGAQPCYALNNHDRSRFISRNDDDGFGRERAHAAPLLLLGLKSTPFLYYGEEIGMEDVSIPPELEQDPARFRHIGRDPERTPMQWDTSDGRGFTNAEPWLPFGSMDISVSQQRADSDSILSVYRRAIWTRNREPSLNSGEFRELPSPHDTFVWDRHAAGERRVICALNTANQPVTIEVPEDVAEVLVCTNHALEGRRVSGSFELPPLGAAWLA